MSVQSEIIVDEFDLIARKLPLAGKRLIELGCGDGKMSRRLVQQAGVAEMQAFEVDDAALAKLASLEPVAGLLYARGEAQDIDADDESFDGALMLKSLHHVPVDQMDAALAEVRRVLKPGSRLYASEPVFDGPLNDIMRLFHDEGLVRQAAIDAIARACERGVFKRAEQIHFMTPVVFADFADFERRMMSMTHTTLAITPAIRAEVKQRFEAFAKANQATTGNTDEVRFVRPMRVDLLERG
ncbi:MAG: methyltransferase domain-containing protein [Burkholderiaceae bacterium]|nr:methyltransferase domain-containing protein [Burkholderiaceae bacterium]